MYVGTDSMTRRINQSLITFNCNKSALSLSKVLLVKDIFCYKMLRFAVVLLLAVSISAFYKPEFKLLKKIRNKIHGKNAEVAEIEAKETLDMPQLYSTYSMMGSHGVDSFFTIPRSVDEAEAQGWVTPEETKDNKLFRTLCTPEDPTICILCDNKGSIAGYQISVSRDVDVNGIEGLDYPKNGFKTQSLFGKDVYSNQIWFVPQEVLTNGGRDYNNQTGTGLWLQVRDELIEVPIHESGNNNTKFVKQNCFVRMGQHYFWDVRDDLAPKDFMPWFTLYSPEGILNGFGFIAFGKQADLSKNKPWLEHVPAVAIKAIAPGVPKWVLEDGGKIGIVSNHVYFGEEPWNIKCAANEIKNYS